MKSIPFLHLECIKTDAQLMKMLPADIARRYHALPVATAGGKITIAMASPEDTVASEAVASAIGTQVCFVQANPEEIQQRLDEIWPQHTSNRLCILLWWPTSEIDQTLLKYSNELANMLNADLERVEISSKEARSFTKFCIKKEKMRPDVIILQPSNLQVMNQILLNLASPKEARQMPTSMLVAQNLRWPLTSILLALPDGESSYHSAVNQAVQLASSSQSLVTVLPLMTSFSGDDRQISRHNVQTLLQTKGPLGLKIRHIAQRFSEDGIKGSFKLREGEPHDQLRCEIFASDPDLVIVAAEPQNCLWIAAELLVSLLDSVKCPILISR